MDQSHSVSSSLSIGYFVSGWRFAKFSNGIVTYVATIVPSLKARGLQVTILASRTGEVSDDNAVYDIQKVQEARGKARRLLEGLYYRVAPARAEAYMNRRSLTTVVRRAVAEREIQMIEMEESFGWSRWVRQATSARVCVRLHGPWFLNGRALGVPEDESFHERVRQEGRGIRDADAITAPSQDVLERVRDFYGIALPEAEVIPNPIRPVPSAERWRLEGADPNQVLFIGRFDRHKGGDLIIEAFARVIREIPDARLRFVGSDLGCVADDGRAWKIEDFIRDRIPGALETGRVEWLGQQPYSALADLRRKSMVSVVCSRYENSPYTAIEAMAMGCPTVGAKTGGIAEIFQDGINGLSHKVGDADDLAAKIIQLLKDPALAAQFGRQAAEDCEQRYYPEVVANRMIEFYRRVLAK